MAPYSSRVIQVSGSPQDSTFIWKDIISPLFICCYHHCSCKAKSVSARSSKVGAQARAHIEGVNKTFLKWTLEL